MLAKKLLSIGNPRLATFLGESEFSSAASSFTATAFSIGQAASDRVIVVCIGSGGSSARQVSGVTIGGNAATLAVRSASIARCTGIYYLAVPSGTTADIVATFSGSVDMAHFSVYSITGWASVTLFDSATATDTGSFTVTATGLDTANDGVIFQVVACNGVGSLSPYVQDASYTVSTHGSICGRVWPSSAATGTSVTHTASGNTAKSICLAAFS